MSNQFIEKSKVKILFILLFLSIFLIDGCQVEKDIVKDFEENARVKELFNKNDLSLKNLKFDSIVEEKDLGINHLNLTIIRFTQEYKGLPIYARQIIYHFNEGKFDKSYGERIDNLNIDVNPRVTKNSAIRIIKERVNILRPDIEIKDEKTILGVFNLDQDPELAYWNLDFQYVVISAVDGEALYEFNGIYT